MTRYIKKEENGKYAIYADDSEDEYVLTPEFETKNELLDYIVENGTIYDLPIPREVAEKFVFEVESISSHASFGNSFLTGFKALEFEMVKEKFKTNDEFKELFNFIYESQDKFFREINE